MSSVRQSPLQSDSDMTMTNGVDTGTSDCLSVGLQIQKDRDALCFEIVCLIGCEMCDLFCEFCEMPQEIK